MSTFCLLVVTPRRSQCAVYQQKDVTEKGTTMGDMPPARGYNFVSSLDAPQEVPPQFRGFKAWPLHVPQFHLCNTDWKVWIIRKKLQQNAAMFDKVFQEQPQYDQFDEYQRWLRKRNLIISRIDELTRALTILGQ